MAQTTTVIPERSQIPVADRWDLGKLFPAEDAWEQGLEQYEEMVPRIAAFKGTLGESAANLRACLEFLNELELLDERVGYYAMLRTSEDAGDSDNQGRQARYLNVASRAEAEKSYVTPEIQAIPDAVMERFLADESLAEFAIALRKLLRFKPHVLPAEQERLLALQIEANQTARKAFAALTDVDLDFGAVDTPDGPVPLSQSSWSQLMIHPTAACAGAPTCSSTATSTGTATPSPPCTAAACSWTSTAPGCAAIGRRARRRCSRTGWTRRCTTT